MVVPTATRAVSMPRHLMALVSSAHAGKVLIVVEYRREQITVFAKPVEDGADREPRGAQVGVVQLIPRDRCRYRGARGGAGAVGRHERLADHVLGVVEPGQPATVG